MKKGDFMDLALIRNVSAAALRAKGRSYPVPGARESERQLMLSPRSNSSAGSGVYSAMTPKTPAIRPGTVASAQYAARGIREQQGLITYARQMRHVPEKNSSTRYDIRI